MNRIQQYGLFEAKITDVRNVETVKSCGVFSKGDTIKVVSAFMSNESEYTLRFMPEETGIWSYCIELENQKLTGEFECIPCTGENHGPVKVKDTHFQYSDGSRYIPFGTTCYAWINQTDELQEQTSNTLKKSCFNKIRMCIFPKSMPYNNNEPERFPFAVKGKDDWDITQPEFAFWDNLDSRIKALCELGIEADIILFHPYDRWGFAGLDQQQSLAYLEYCIARLAAYRNVWWSLANEYELVYRKSMEDWNEYGEMLMEKDQYHHPVSIHQILCMYPRKKWMTHCSVQTNGIHNIPLWEQEYNIPIIIDECGYEGDIEYSWGNISAFEMVNRFWISVCRGGYCTHGETFHREDEVLWWAKGGKLYGKSEPRIAFLKELLYSLPEGKASFQATGEEPNQDKENHEEDQQEKIFKTLLEHASPDRKYDMISGNPMILRGEGYHLEYFGSSCPAYARVDLPQDGSYRVEIIDVWEMIRTLAAEEISGKIKIDLPAKEGIGILIYSQRR